MRARTLFTIGFFSSSIVEGPVVEVRRPLDVIANRGKWGGDLDLSEGAYWGTVHGPSSPVFLGLEFVRLIFEIDHTGS